MSEIVADHAIVAPAPALAPYVRRVIGYRYLVATDPAALYARACAAGARSIAAPHDTDYGSRDFTVADPEGVLWSVGTYAGAD